MSSGIEERLPVLIEERKEHLVTLRANQADPAKDRKGSATSSVARSLRFMGVAEYIQNKNVKAFRENLSEGARLRKTLFERFENGGPIPRSYVSMLSYKWLFDALAAGDFQLAREFARHMGGRTEIEREHDHPFDLALGYLLRSSVLDDTAAVTKWLVEFQALCSQPDNADFAGYAKVFEAIAERNVDVANEGFAELVEGHRRQSKRGGVFEGDVDEALCVWGIGLANLARLYGMSVQPREPLIPADLLI